MSPLSTSSGTQPCAGYLASQHSNLIACSKIRGPTSSSQALRASRPRWPSATHHVAFCHCGQHEGTPPTSRFPTREQRPSRTLPLQLLTAQDSWERGPRPPHPGLHTLPNKVEWGKQASAQALASPPLKTDWSSKQAADQALGGSQACTFFQLRRSGLNQEPLGWCRSGPPEGWARASTA